jgi:hypothetical protein
LPHGPASRDGAANDVDGGVNDLFAALGVAPDGTRIGSGNFGGCNVEPINVVDNLSTTFLRRVHTGGLRYTHRRLGVQFQIDRLAARRLLRPVG